jgi:uncharacterized membrane protein
MNFSSKFKENSFGYWAIIIPWVAFLVILISGSLLFLDYIHVLTGAIWTGTDIFLGLIFSRVIKTLDLKTKADVSKRILPITLYFIPSVSILTPVAGMVYALRENTFAGLSFYFIVALFLTGIILVLISFLLILPSSLKIKRMTENWESKDEENLLSISSSIRRITIYAAMQLLFQIIIIGFMAYLVVF